MCVRARARAQSGRWVLAVFVDECVREGGGEKGARACARKRNRTPGLVREGRQMRRVRWPPVCHEYTQRGIMDTHTHTHTHTHTSVFLPLNQCSFLSPFLSLVPIARNVCVCICERIYINIYIHTYIHTYIHVLSLSLFSTTRSKKCVCMCACV